jgi:hypothetical protein
LFYFDFAFPAGALRLPAFLVRVAEIEEEFAAGLLDPFLMLLEVVALEDSFYFLPSCLGSPKEALKALGKANDILGQRVIGPHHRISPPPPSEGWHGQASRR